MKSLIVVVVAALSCVAFADGGPEGGARPKAVVTVLALVRVALAR